jgi:hypothetical protein
LKGEIEHIPLPDASVDVVISNCVINLSADTCAIYPHCIEANHPDIPEKLLKLRIGFAMVGTSGVSGGGCHDMPASATCKLTDDPSVNADPARLARYIATIIYGICSPSARLCNSRRAHSSPSPRPAAWMRVKRLAPSR